MEPFRLKLKVGPHEFEAEGDQETVERQLNVWRELIASPASAPTLASPPPLIAPPPGQLEITGFPPAVSVAVAGGPDYRAEYAKLFKHDGRVVSLTIAPNGAQREADAALLLLLGQLTYNNVDLVTGQAISDGLKQSGMAVERVDRMWGSHSDSNVLRSGVNRGVRYRLSNPGLVRARELAGELLKLVP